MGSVSTIVPSVSRAAVSAAVLIIVGGALFWIAFDGGSYGIIERGSLAVVALWALAIGVGLGLWPRVQVPRAALVTGGLIAGLAAWIGLSTLWGESAERSIAEFNRVTLYLAIFSIAVVAIDRRRLLPALGGIAIATTGIGVLALASRLFPNLVAETSDLAQLFPAAQKRLSYPINYWNGLATFVGFAVPLLLFFATTLRHSVLRGLALAPVPALAATIYLTSSRGGALATALGVVMFIALSGRRWAAVFGTAWVLAGSALVIAVLRARPELVDQPLESNLAESQGKSAALIIAAVCLVAGVSWAVASRFAPLPPRLPRPVRIALVAALAGLMAAGIVAVDPRERFERFKEVRPELVEASVQEHLFAGSGSGRWQLWEVALDEFERDPLIGQGAGTYEAAWAKDGTLDFFVRDAHSLYLEMLGEVGVVGLALLLGVLLVAFVAAARRLTAGAPDDRSVIAVLVAVLSAYMFEAGFDWIWEVTAVSVVAFAAIGLLTGPATALTQLEQPSQRSMFRAAIFAAAISSGGVQALPLLAELNVRESQDTAARGITQEAIDEALAARSLAPWAASPRLQLALAHEVAGDLPSAQDAISGAIERDSADWRLWLVAARIQTKAEQFDDAQRSLNRARELNPRSRLFAE